MEEGVRWGKNNEVGNNYLFLNSQNYNWGEKATLKSKWSAIKAASFELIKCYNHEETNKETQNITWVAEAASEYLPDVAQDFLFGKRAWWLHVYQQVFGLLLTFGKQ